VKKALAILLLLVVCMLSCMFPLRYSLKQAAKAVMHHRMQQGRESAYVLMSAADLKGAEWEHDREFRLKGQMYDVEGIEYHDGLKYYRCIADGLETRLERKADDIANSMTGHAQPDSRQRVAKALSDWLQCLYCNAEPARYQAPAAVSSTAFFLRNAGAPQDPCLRQQGKPPEAELGLR
jgi:hypothetical protein